jgi:hypothetical protein
MKKKEADGGGAVTAKSEMHNRQSMIDKKDKNDKIQRRCHDHKKILLSLALFLSLS